MKPIRIGWIVWDIHAELIEELLEISNQFDLKFKYIHETIYNSAPFALLYHDRL